MVWVKLPIHHWKILTYFISSHFWPTIPSSKISSSYQEVTKRQEHKHLCPYVITVGNLHLKQNSKINRIARGLLTGRLSLWKLGRPFATRPCSDTVVISVFLKRQWVFCWEKIEMFYHQVLCFMLSFAIVMIQVWQCFLEKHWWQN